MSYNRPDVVVIDREENTWHIVDFAIPMDHHVKENEKEKINKYMDWQLRLEESDCTNCFRSFGDSPGKTIGIARKIGNGRPNWKLANCCFNIHYT